MGGDNNPDDNMHGGNCPPQRAVIPLKLLMRRLYLQRLCNQHQTLTSWNASSMIHMGHHQGTHPRRPGMFSFLHVALCRNISIVAFIIRVRTLCPPTNY
ncbi:hypothetical protein YC2023_010038 [Brassica napus]